MVEESIFEGHHCVLICPHCAIDWQVSFRIIGLLILVILLIALLMAILGAWLVLPFAGLEVLLVLVANWYWHQSRKQRESLIFADDELIFNRQAKGMHIQHRCQLFWTRLLVEKTGHPSHPQQRLFLKHRQQRWPIADYLSDDEKQQLLMALARHMTVVRL